jgi:hypothetical protein
MQINGDFLTAIDIDITGNGEAINANTNGGLYAIQAFGGSLASINAGNGITLGNNTTGTQDGTFRYTGSDAEVLKSGVWTSLTEVSTPAGANTEIQFNNNGAFGASSSLTFDGTTLEVTGDLDVTGSGTFANNKILMDNNLIGVSELPSDYNATYGHREIAFVRDSGGMFSYMGTYNFGNSFDYNTVYGSRYDHVWMNYQNEGMRLDSSGDLSVTGSVTGATLHANNGFTGTGAYTNFTITDGIITSAS